MGLSAASLLAELLETLPQVKLLVTSRERLNLHGEWTYELHGLAAFALFFGVVFGIGGNGIGLVPSNTAVAEWFRERLGLALGVATMGIGTKVEVKGKIKAGVVCPGGNPPCTFERAMDDFTAKVTPTLDAPSLGDLRVEPSLSAFGYMEASIGNVFLKSLRFDFVKAKAGATLPRRTSAMISKVPVDSSSVPSNLTETGPART